MIENSTERLLEIVSEALEQEPAHREAFLDRVCGGDTALRTEAGSLVRFDEPARDFISRSEIAAHAAAFLETHETSVPVRSLSPGQMLGDFRIDSLLGEGGMGEVYLAEDTSLSRLVAIKVAKVGLSSHTLLRKFGEEKRILAGLTHQHIARLYGGSLMVDGRPYLVMEYVEGERLDDYCKNNRLSVDARLTLFRKVCAAVAYAHQHLVIHRDLKPANICVTSEGEPKLLDFGIAKLLEVNATGPQADATVTMGRALTPRYASPEQLRGEEISTASDVYSLGVILFELLTEESVFSSVDRRPDEVARDICELEPPRPSTVVGRRPVDFSTDNRVGGESPSRLRRRLAGDLDNVVAMALRKNPARRYLSVGQFAEDIRRHGEGLPVAARKDTLTYRFGKLVRRHKTAAAAAAFVVMALVAGTAATSWQAHVAGQARDRAQAAQVKSEEARKRSERLNAFLENILSSPDPAHRGHDAKVADVVDAAAKNLDRDLADDPELLAQMHETLALTYRHLAMFAPAEQHAREAVAFLRRSRNDADPTRVKAELNLADVLALRTSFTEAEPLLRELLAVERRQPGPEPHLLADTLSRLGGILMATGRTREAEPLLVEVTQLRAGSDENSGPYAASLIQLGNLNFYENDFSAAAARYRQSITIMRRMTPDTPDIPGVENSLGVALFRLGKLDETEVVLRQGLEDCQRILGNGNNQLYGFLESTSALVSFVKGDYPKVISEAQTALEMLKDSGLSRTSVDIVYANALIGSALTRRGHAADGEPYLRKAYMDGHDLDKSNFELTIGNLDSALGECLLEQNHYAEAEPLLLIGCNDLKTRLGEHNAVTQAVAQRLSRLYAEWNGSSQRDRHLPPEPLSTSP